MTTTAAAPVPDRLRVAVLGGGRNDEHEVSRASATAVAQALSAHHDVTVVTLGRHGDWLLEGRVVSAAEGAGVLAAADVVFPALHGRNGEDGAAAGLLELLGVSYVGSGVIAGAVAMDKHQTKLLAEALGIRIARGRSYRRGDAAPDWSGPVVVKPLSAGSSQGVTLVDAPEKLSAALAEAWAHDDTALVEELIRGREIDVAVLEGADGSLRCAPILEIPRPVGTLFSHDAKYGGDPGFIIPAALSPAVRAAAEEAARAMFHALGCRDLARVDFFLDEKGLVFNEVNTMPGLTEHSQLPAMVAAEGTGYAAFLDGLVRAAWSRRR